MAGLDTDAQRSDGAGDQHFARGGFASFAGDFYGAAVKAVHFITEARRFELEASGAERVGLNDLRARVDIRLMHAKDGFRLRGVQLIEAALRAHGFVQHGTHRPVADEDGIFQPLVEILDFQGWVVLFIENVRGVFSAWSPSALRRCSSSRPSSGSLTACFPFPRRLREFPARASS